jgi:hypothetical protein
MEVTIIDAAKAIRLYLPDLVVDSADGLDSRLAELLGAAVPPDLEQSIRELLSSQPETREWTAAFLELGEPPEVHAYPERGVLPESLPGSLGDVRPVRAKRFECPHRDMTFYRRYAGQSLPLCKTHHIAMEPTND